MVHIVQRTQESQVTFSTNIMSGKYTYIPGIQENYFLYCILKLREFHRYLNWLTRKTTVTEACNLHLQSIDNRADKLVPRVSLLLVLWSERETLVWSGHVRPIMWDVAKKRMAGGADKFTFWLH